MNDIALLAPSTVVEASTSASANVAAPRPLPSFAAEKPRLSDRDLADKREGAYWTGLPLLDVNPDTGAGFGARLYRYWDGTRADPFFAVTPYRHRVFGQTYATTKGLQLHTIDWESLYLADSPFRLRASLTYERNVLANYFGRGASTVAPLQLRGDAYSDFAAYTGALREISPDGRTWTRYDKYDRERKIAAFLVERDLLGGVVRVSAGLTFAHVAIRDLTGKVVPGDDPRTGARDVDAVQAKTRLREDCDAGKLVGCEGGWNDTLKLGIAYDTRDFEPDPNEGVFADATLEIASPALGARHPWARFTAAARGYVRPFPKLADVVLAARVAGSAQVRDVPFHAMGVFAFTDGDRGGVGGLRTLRGYREERFVGHVLAIAGAEARWTFTSFDVFGEHFALIAAGFVDFGRVYDRIADFGLRGYRRGQGGALRIAWNEATVVSIDYARSAEDEGLYVDFGHPF